MAMKKILFVLMPQGFKDIEFSAPLEALKGADHHVDVAGLEPGLATGADGLEYTPNLLLDDLTEEDFVTYDALVIPGGPGSVDYTWHNKELQNVVRFFHQQGKVVAAICYGCIVLAQAGILAGKRATVYPTDETKEIFSNNNVTFLDSGCVVLDDERIITAQGPRFVTEFSTALINALTP